MIYQLLILNHLYFSQMTHLFSWNVAIYFKEENIIRKYVLIIFGLLNRWILIKNF